MSVYSINPDAGDIRGEPVREPVTDDQVTAQRAADTARRYDAYGAADAAWLYGDSPGGLRMQAAEALAAEFGDDVSEWLA
jgi:hypothetical protein